MKMRGISINSAIILVAFLLSVLAHKGYGESSSYSGRLSFTKSSQSFDPAFTRLILLRDFDSDGDLDAVFSNCTLFDSRVWLNNGNGLFTATEQLLSKQAHGIDAGDLDGDGDLDLFITCHYFVKDGVSYHLSSKVYLNDGNAVFYDNGQDFGDSLLSGNVVNLYDIDGDDDLDAMIQYFQEPDRIYFNNGKAQFSLSNLSFPDFSTFGDLDNDGKEDILASVPGIGYEVWRGNGDGTFTKAGQLTDSTATPSPVSLGDLDQDGDLDAVITRFYSNDSFQLKIWYNDGKGGFEQSNIELPVVFRGSVTLGDLDNDGFIDAVAASHGSEVFILINDGSGKLIDTGIRLGEKSDKNESAALGDIDNDGDLDIFVAEGRGGKNVIWLNEMVKE
ncbi:MAG: VCBS repeat-containing protein [Candidatus Zixiibacteriota bacterium]|nr:MAG: VCBS repeat-containing protein [candidate division Zixibacteria bacterium]